MIDTSSGGPPADRRQFSPVVGVAACCEGLALVASVAANLLAVWRDGAVAIGFAVLVPLILIGATYMFLFDRLPVAWSRRAEGWQAWWANLAAAALILVPVASASYWHQRGLLIHVHTATWIATLLPLAVDGLALRAALTLFRLAHAETASAGADTRQDIDADIAADTSATTTDEALVVAPEPRDAPVDTGEPEPPLPVVGNIPSEVVTRAFAILDADPTTGRPALIKALDVGDSPARRLQTAWKRHRSRLRSVEVGEAS